MVDGVALGIGSVVAIAGVGLALAATAYAREMANYVETLGPLGAVLVPPFVPKDRVRAYLRWTARVAGIFIAIVGVLYLTSAFRSR